MELSFAATAAHVRATLCDKYVSDAWTPRSVEHPSEGKVVHEGDR